MSVVDDGTEFDVSTALGSLTFTARSQSHSRGTAWLFRFSVALRPQRPRELLGTRSSDDHLDSHTAPDFLLKGTCDLV